MTEPAGSAPRPWPYDENDPPPGPCPCMEERSAWRLRQEERVKQAELARVRRLREGG